jgi:TM2 domain-containing membrane protein YozV
MTARLYDSLSPVAALALGWAIPGAGHAYAGKWGKAVLFFVCITGLLAAGMIMSGGTILLPDRLWYAAQVCAGGPAIALTALSKHLAPNPAVIDWANRLHETGTLYTAVAGFLNLLVMMDAYIKLAYPERGREEEKP